MQTTTNKHELTRMEFCEVRVGFCAPTSLIREPSSFLLIAIDALSLLAFIGVHSWLTRNS